MKLSSFSLRRLRWKLTLSYTLVTVGTLLLVELVALLGVAAFLRSDTMAQLMSYDLKQATAPRLQPHLVQAPPDLEGLRETLRESFYGPFAPEEAEGAAGPGFFGAGVPADESLTVLDTEQRLLGSVSGTGELAAGENFDVQRLPGLDALLAVALDGEDDPDLLHASSTDDRVFAVTPIKAEDESVVGAVVATSRSPDIARFLLPTVLVSAGVFTLGAGLVGTLFGFLTARGLTKRLRKLTHASEAWSRGDFSVVSKDRSRDELGQLSRDLDHMAGQLENLMQTRGELATLEARNRFARDLHDSVKQQVFATSLQIAAARALIGEDKEAAGDHLAQAEGLVRGAQRELNVLIHEMRPAALEGKGLADALRDYAADWSRGCEILVRVRVRGEREASLEVEQALFRVTQEALANTAKHSGAREAEVELVYDAEALTLRVSDDGRGFDPGSPKGGIRPRKHAGEAREARRARRGRERAGEGHAGRVRLSAERFRGGRILSEPITVLLVDDHAMVRQGVRAFLETQGDIVVVGEAGGGEEAVLLAAEHAPDVALTDLIMPGMDGVEATRRLTARSPRTSVVILTSYHDDEHVFPAIRAGALSYVLKEIGAGELADAVRKAAVGEAVLHPRVAARVVRELHGAGGAEPNVFHQLSERELEVLKLIADGLSNAEIAARLYLSEKTVKSHVSNILSKLHLADRTQAAVYAWRQGVVRRG